MNKWTKIFKLCLLTSSLLASCRTTQGQLSSEQASTKKSGERGEIFTPFDRNGKCGCLQASKGEWICEDFKIKGEKQGSFLHKKIKNAKYILATPHGWFDNNVEMILANIHSQKSIDRSLAESLSVVVAQSFRGNCDNEYAYNVNRPSVDEEDGDFCPSEKDIKGQRKIGQVYWPSANRKFMHPRNQTTTIEFEGSALEHPGVNALGLNRIC